MDMSHHKLTGSSTWEEAYSFNIAMENHCRTLENNKNQNPIVDECSSLEVHNHHQLSITPPWSQIVVAAAPNILGFHHNFKVEAAGEDLEEEEEEEQEEELGAMKEMMFKIAAMQPVDIDPATIRKPKRRNVRISEDPQSVAARHRRERISEKIRILQRLVPGGTKMDTASMLDEAIRYVKFLKRQIRHLQVQSQANHHQPPLLPPPADDWATNATVGSSCVFGGNYYNNNDGAGHYNEDPMCFNHKF